MRPNYQLVINKLGKSRVLINESLVQHTTFRIGGPADLFYEVKNKEELIRAVGFCRELKIPYFILGGGSNLLVSDKGIRGMVIKIHNSEFIIHNSEVRVEAGVSLPFLVQETAKRKLSGLEFCAGIPGTVGGAVVGNAGSKKEWIGSQVVTVEVLTEGGRIKKIPAKNCQFGYRSSRFQSGKEIILGATLKLNHDNSQNIKNRIAYFFKERKNQPKGFSAGSIFKNPRNESAGKLIEQTGLKGYQIGQAKFSSQHANFILNLGEASCFDVLRLISLAKKKIKEKFGLKLAEEIKIIGEF